MAQQVRSCGSLAKKLADGDVFFKAPQFILDHRKIYLLKADDGRTRLMPARAVPSSVT